MCRWIFTHSQFVFICHPQIFGLMFPFCLCFFQASSSIPSFYQILLHCCPLVINFVDFHFSLFSLTSQNSEILKLTSMEICPCKLLILEILLLSHEETWLRSMNFGFWRKPHWQIFETFSFFFEGKLSCLSLHLLHRACCMFYEKFDYTAFQDLSPIYSFIILFQIYLYHDRSFLILILSYFYYLIRT